jgi:hypothetical protein
MGNPAATSGETARIGPRIDGLRNLSEGKLTMALRLIGLLLVLWATATSAADKQVAGVNALSELGLDYYGAWGGTLSRAIDPAAKEGAGSLRLDYSLSAGSGNFVEYLRNYDKSTQDYNFMPSGLSIWIKGNGSGDRFRFQLFEDKNLNGTFEEPGEEVWVWSHSTILSKTGWNKVSMPFANFKRLAGNDNNALDLARIGKWRIVIDNPAGTARAASSVWVDDLRLVNTYAVPTTAKAISGSFLQIWNDVGCACGNWTQARWNTEMQTMADVGMNTLIVQYGMYGDGAGTVTAFYPSNLGFVTYRQPTLDYIMAAAQARGQKVVVGLYFNANWDGDLAWDQPATYNDVEFRNRQVIDEIWSRYGANPAFGGWYIPQEIDDLNWQSDGNRALLAGMVQNLAAHAKGKNAALPVMIAPYFRMNQPADVYRDWWVNFLAAAPSVDWVIPQDGVGTNGTDGDTDVPYYFAALQYATGFTGRNLGATVESFQQTGSSTFVPTTIARLQDQLKVAGSYATRIFQFEWSYMEPSLEGAHRQLYDGYKALGLPPAP